MAAIGYVTLVAKNRKRLIEVLGCMSWRSR